MESGSVKRALSDINSESQDEAEHLFPSINASEFQQSIEALKAGYSKEIHARQLVNYCYRCHQPAISSAYLKFKSEHHPELQAPAISAFFENDSFIELTHIGAYLHQQAEYPAIHMPPVPKNLKTILDEIFETFGCIPNLQRFLLFYPSYLEKHLQLKKNLFDGDRIDAKLAYFLGFCGAAELSCIYMMVRYYGKFKAAGGDIRWINQGKYPAKYKGVLELNRLLAKAVWQIDEDFMVDLYQNSGYQWNQSEIAVCLEILTFAQQNSTIALALGLNCEERLESMELLGIQNVSKLIEEYRSRVYAPSDTKQKLAVLIPHLNEQGQQCLTSLKKAIKKVEGEQQVQTYMKQIGQQLSKQELNTQISQHLQPLFQQHKIIEKRRENKYPTIDYSEYNFTFMAYPRLNNLTQKVADKLLNLINYSQTMSKDNFGSEKINTKEFRKAIRYYAENLCGYRHHQYDYKTNVSLYLTLALKFFVRLLTLSPVHINQHVIREIHHESGQIQCFDIGHVAIIIANTKMSLGLSLAMRAFDIQ